MTSFTVFGSVFFSTIFSDRLGKDSEMTYFYVECDIETYFLCVNINWRYQ